MKRVVDRAAFAELVLWIGSTLIAASVLLALIIYLVWG